MICVGVVFSYFYLLKKSRQYKQDVDFQDKTSNALFRFQENCRRVVHRQGLFSISFCGYQSTEVCLLGKEFEVMCKTMIQS